MRFATSRWFRAACAATAIAVMWPAAPRAQQEKGWVKLAPLPEPAQEIGGIAAERKSVGVRRAADRQQFEAQGAGSAWHKGSNRELRQRAPATTDEGAGGELSWVARAVQVDGEGYRS